MNLIFKIEALNKLGYVYASRFFQAWFEDAYVYQLVQSYKVTEHKKNYWRINKFTILENNSSVVARRYRQKYFGKLIVLNVRNLFGTVISDTLRKFRCNDWSDSSHDGLYLNK